PSGIARLEAIVLVDGLSVGPAQGIETVTDDGLLVDPAVVLDAVAHRDQGDSRVARAEEGLQAEHGGDLSVPVELIDGPPLLDVDSRPRVCESSDRERAVAVGV